jgi:hypothetical protein
MLLFTTMHRNRTNTFRVNNKALAKQKSALLKFESLNVSQTIPREENNEKSILTTESTKKKKKTNREELHHCRRVQNTFSFVCSYVAWLFLLSPSATRS